VKVYFSSRSITPDSSWCGSFIAGESSFILVSGLTGDVEQNPGDYNAFVISRLFGGMFGACPSILGTGMITDIFFLHERGKAFSTFLLCFLLGTLAGPTFGGFIVQHVSWPAEFWWTIGLQALVIILGKPIIISDSGPECHGGIMFERS
jgi:MFS family permease